MAAQALTILNTIIHRRGDLYSLNDLHKASGSASKHKPANFMRRDQTREMVEEIQFSEMSTAFQAINGGPNRGTYVCRELVIAYAAWISAAFHLKVIRVFLNTQTEQLAIPLHHEPVKVKIDLPQITIPSLNNRMGRNAWLTYDELWRMGDRAPIAVILRALSEQGYDVSAASLEYQGWRHVTEVMSSTLQRVALSATGAARSGLKLTYSV